MAVVAWHFTVAHHVIPLQDTRNISGVWKLVNRALVRRAGEGSPLDLITHSELVSKAVLQDRDRKLQLAREGRQQKRQLQRQTMTGTDAQ